MNDEKIADPNICYIDKYPDRVQVAEPRKLTEEEYLQRMIEEVLSPRAAEVNPTMRAADSDEGIHRSR